MTRINILPPLVADMIAAGEVVERPASVIKELMENSFDAGASKVTVEFKSGGATYIKITDDGCGMSEDMVRAVCDPFTTTRKTRKVGLGLPLLKMTAQATGGEMSIASKPGEGTTVRVTFGLSHIDRPPMGDVPGVLYTLVLMNPTTDFRFALDYDGKTFVLDTREVREAVAPIPLDHPEISAWIRDCLKQNIDELHGGVFL